MHRLSLISLFLLWAPWAQGQVELTFQLPNHEVLELEPVPAVVTLHNPGAQALRRDADYALSFDVLQPNGVQVGMRDKQIPYVPAELPPGSRLSFTNDLSLLYKIQQQGPYTVAARLSFRTRAMVSGREFLDVMPGSELASAEGLAVDGTPRRYSLRQLSRNKQSRIYLRVDDPDASLCYGVIDLGRQIPIRPPELLVDSHGLVHILHLTGPAQFVHSVFGANGEMVAQQTHPGDANAVHLVPDDESGYRVDGVGISEPRDPFIDTLPGRKHL